MAAVTKPDVTTVWASGGEATPIPKAKQAQGWGEEIPEYDDFNGMVQQLSQFNAHVNQQGVPSWDSVTEYQNNSWAKGNDGMVYVAQQVHVNKDPTKSEGNTFWVSLVAYLAGLLAVNKPGDYKMVAHNSDPDAGWLKCNGQILSRAAYPALFNKIGTSYNTAGGISNTQFQLPDLRGEFVRGLDDGRGVDPARQLNGQVQLGQNEAHLHSITVDAVGSHSHGLNNAIKGDRASVQAADNMVWGDESFYQTGGLATDAAGAHSHNARAGSSGGSEARPRNIAVVYWIKT